MQSIASCTSPLKEQQDVLQQTPCMLQTIADAVSRGMGGLPAVIASSDCLTEPVLQKCPFNTDFWRQILQSLDSGVFVTL
jgi:hypothetical protein